MSEAAQMEFLNMEVPLAYQQTDEAEENELQGSNKDAKAEINQMLRPMKKAVVRAKTVQQLFKTELCKFFTSGRCELGNECPYAHGVDDVRRKPDLTQTSMCKVLLKTGNCKDDTCRFAHTDEEVRFTSGFYKIKMCGFVKSGKCKHGETCRFAHSHAELRQAKQAQMLSEQGAALTQPINAPPPPQPLPNSVGVRAARERRKEITNWAASYLGEQAPEDQQAPPEPIWTKTVPLAQALQAQLASCRSPVTPQMQASKMAAGPGHGNGAREPKTMSLGSVGTGRGQMFFGRGPGSATDFQSTDAQDAGGDWSSNDSSTGTEFPISDDSGGRRSGNYSSNGHSSYSRHSNSNDSTSAGQARGGGRGGRHDERMQGPKKIRDEAGYRQGGKKIRDEVGYQQVSSKNDEDSAKPDNEKTTLLLTNIPSYLTQGALLSMFEDLTPAMRGNYDFFYSPWDQEVHHNLGYALINFKEPHHALNFQRRWADKEICKGSRGQKALRVMKAALQGLEANVEYFSKVEIARCADLRFRPLVCDPATGGLQPLLLDGQKDQEQLNALRAASSSQAPPPPPQQQQQQQPQQQQQQHQQQQQQQQAERRGAVSYWQQRPVDFTPQQREFNINSSGKGPQQHAPPQQQGTQWEQQYDQQLNQQTPIGWQQNNQQLSGGLVPCVVMPMAGMVGFNNAPQNMPRQFYPMDMAQNNSANMAQMPMGQMPSTGQVGNMGAWSDVYHD